MTGIIHPYLYEFDLSSLERCSIVRYSLAFNIYNAIKEAQGIVADHAVAFSGLHAVLGWAAPCVDLVSIAAPSPGEQKTIVMTSVEPLQSIEEIRREIEVAISIWLGIILPEHAPKISAMMSDGRNTRGAECAELAIDTSLKWSGACTFPADYRLYDIISLVAARAIEGQVLNEGTPDEGRLVLSGAQQSLYMGKTLQRYAPTRVDKKHGAGWWTEIFNVASVTTPESQRLRVAINVGTRNFGEIHEARLRRNRARLMDVFLPANAALAPGNGRMRFVELKTTRGDWWRAKQGEAKWESPDRRVLKTILDMSGIVFEDQALGLKPLIGETVGLYPRFGTVHGDQWAPGGTGVSHPEREEYLAFLDKHLGANGFSRVKMQRVTKRGAKERLATPIGSMVDDLRAAVSKRFEGGEAALCLLQSRPSGAKLFDEAIKGVIGAPQNIAASSWTYGEEFSLTVRHEPAGPLAQLLEAPDEEMVAGVPKHLRYRAQGALRSERDKLARERMSAYLDSALSTLPNSWMGLIEMNEALCQEDDRDPYLLAYQAIAKSGGVAQVKLFNPEGEPASDCGSEEGDFVGSDSFAYQNSILDLFRSSGVCPVQEQQVRLAAWWVINSNDQAYGRQAGASGGMCTPLYIECDEGVISVCLIGPDDRLVRCSYSDAIALFANGGVANLRFKKKEEQNARIAQFFAQATPRDDRRTVLFVEATNIRSSIPAFRNSGQFSFDHLQLGGVGAAAPVREILSSGAISIVRITDEAVKAPSYWVEKNTQGTTAGVFHEEGAERTYWISRGLPTPLQISSRQANKKSRHDQGAGQYKHRRFPALSEVTVVVQSEREEIWELIKLTRTMMQCHIATDEKTILPFPLHEGKLLSGAAR